MTLDRTQPPTEEKVKCVSCKLEEPANVPKNPMIQCDVCEAWFHYSCVGVGDEMKNLAWCCEVCRVDEEDDNASSTSVIEAPDVTINKLKLKMERREQTFARQMEAKCKAQEKEIAELRSMFAQFSSNMQGVIPETSSNPAQVIPQSSEQVEQRSPFDENQAPKVNEENEELPGRFSAHQPMLHHSTAPIWFDTRRNESDIAINQLTVTMRRQFISKLPSFGGAAKEWAYFEAIYNSSTEEGQFTESENVVRLREALKKPAFDLVQHLLMYSTDAKQIMADLKGAYGRPDELIIVLTEEILAIPPLKGQSDPKLREFAIALKNFVANIKALKRSSDLTNEYTLSKMVEKLQEATGSYKEWARKKIANPNENLDSFASFLMEKALEMPPGLLPSEVQDVGD